MMFDANWDLIEGEVAHQIEVLNQANQVNLIEAVVRFLLNRHPPQPGAGCAGYPDEFVLKELHRAGTLLLLALPGEYRENEVHVARNDGSIIHTPPTCAEIRNRMDEFFQRLTTQWAAGVAVFLGAFSLWMLNWVHPFKNGNGRTARGFAYACISLKLGFVLPGSPTVIDLVTRQREEYQSALKVADLSFEASGAPDLEPMRAFIHRLLVQQLSSL